MVTTVEKLEIVQAAKNKQIYDSDFSVQWRNDRFLFQFMAFGLHGVNGPNVSRFSAEWLIEHGLGHVTHLHQCMATVTCTVRERIKRQKVRILKNDSLLLVD
jgi:hypothetical protein